jgi:hypothetical protein
MILSRGVARIPHIYSALNYFSESSFDLFFCHLQIFGLNGFCFCLYCDIVLDYDENIITYLDFF